MLKKEKISSKQLTYIIFITIISTGMIFVPKRIYSIAGQDSWLSVILGGLIGILLAYFISQLGLIYRDKTIIEYSQIILGKTLGKIIGLSIFLAFFFINSVVLREFAELLVGAFYPHTPKVFFIIAIIFVSSYALYQGLEIIARVNEILFPIFMILIIFIFIFTISEMNFQKLFPILANGILPVLKGAYTHALWYVEIIILSFFIPSLNVPTRAQKASILGVTFVILLSLVMMTGIVAVFGKETSTLTFPVLSFGRYVNIANFLEQLDSFILVIWVAGVFIKITVFQYCSVISLSQLLKLTDHKPLILPISILQTILAIVLWNNTAQLTFQLFSYINSIYTIGIVSLLTLLFVIAQIKKLSDKRNNNG